MIFLPLTLNIPSTEGWDPIKEEFVLMNDDILILEHSLYAVSKWESKWKIPFLDTRNSKTDEQTTDYFRCMIINEANPDALSRLSYDDMQTINNYINDPMTATTIKEKGGKRSSRIVTSELIYSQMIGLGIPLECDRWHLNRLLMLIRVCNAENEPKKQMGRGDLYKQYAHTNAMRRKAKRH